MKFVQYVVCVWFFAVSTVSTGAQQNTLLPVRGVPHGMHIIEVNGGGRIIYGPMIAAKSAHAAILSGMTRMKIYFASVHPDKLIRFPAGDQFGSTFSATLGGVAVSGIAVSVKDVGGARFGFAFDDVRRFTQTSGLILHQLAVAMRKMAPIKTSINESGSSVALASVTMSRQGRCRARCVAARAISLSDAQ